MPRQPTYGAGKTYLVKQNARVIEAHTAQDLHNGLDETNVVHGLSKLDVAKVPGAVCGFCLVRFAFKLPVGSTHAKIIKPIGLGLAFVIQFSMFHFAH